MKEIINAFNGTIPNAYAFLRKPCINIALPGFAWMFGRWCNFLAGVLTGVTDVTVDPLTPENILDTFKRERPTHMHGAPPLYHSTVDGLLSLKKREIANLEILHYSGTVIPPDLARKLRSITHLVTSYGLSEIGPVVVMTVFDPPYAQIYASGRPAWGNKLAITDTEGSRLGTGEEGEIVVKGPGLMLGYFNNPEANAQAFRGDGFFKTGDLGFFDEYGYLHVTGRIKDVIDRGGYKFSAREVEELILSHPKVKDAGIVGMPDEKLGERGCAFVVLREHEALKLEELVAFLKAKGLATFKLPERLEIIEALPYTPTGKMQKYILREQIAKALQSRGA
jgi:acyl-CoA synthetase